MLCGAACLTKGDGASDCEHGGSRVTLARSLAALRRLGMTRKLCLCLTNDAFLSSVNIHRRTAQKSDERLIVGEPRGDPHNDR